MTGFEVQTSGIGTDHWATTAAPPHDQVLVEISAFEAEVQLPSNTILLHHLAR